MGPRNEKHESGVRPSRGVQLGSWLRGVTLSGPAPVVALLAAPGTPVAADPPSAPRWHVVVSTAPHLPRDVWFAGKGNNTDGWTSGGSICLNQLAQGLPNGEQVPMLLDVVEGGLVGADGMPVAAGTYAFPGRTEPAVDHEVTRGTTFYVIVDAYGVQSGLDMFPLGETFTFMRDYAEGRSDRQVVLWLYFDGAFVPFVNEGTMMAMTRSGP